MSHPIGKIVPVLVVLAVAVVGALGPDDARSVAQAASGPQESLIVNPASNPARTTIVGPVTATIANTQAIPVTVEGTPSVAVSGAVTIAGTPNVAVPGGVTVANTEAEAIPVRDVHAAPTPWVGGGQIFIEPGELFGVGEFFQVPSGRRLVIEAFSVEAGLPTGQVATQGTILANAGTDGVTFRFPLPPMPSATITHSLFGTFQLTKLNVMAAVNMTVSRNATAGVGLVNVALSGYLVDED